MKTNRTTRIGKTHFIVAFSVCLAVTQHARAEDGTIVLDGRLGYPLVLNSGPSDSRYLGNVMLDGRVLVIGQVFGGGIGVDYYSLSNRVPASGAIVSKVHAGVTNVPIYFAARLLKGPTNSVLGDIIVAPSVGLAARFIEPVKGSMLAATVGTDVSWYIHTSNTGEFFLAPNVAFTYVSEAHKSSIGALFLATFGVRIGFKSR